jgi:putative peptide zinc metalloprotease protein
VLIVVPSLLYWVIGFMIIVPQVLPVLWHQLIWLIQGVGTAAATGQLAIAALGAVNILLLLLPCLGSLLLLGMLLRDPVRWVLARRGPAQPQKGWL